jgi:hypothetical protein
LHHDSAKVHDSFQAAKEKTGKKQKEQNGTTGNTPKALFLRQK